MTMQAIMWGLLGCTIALAAVVTHTQRNAGEVKLSSQTITSGNVSVRLPEKWRAKPRSDDDARLIAQAAESSTEGPGRSIRIYTERIDRPMSPQAYLTDRFGISVPDLGEADESDGASVAPMPIGDNPGIAVTVVRAMPGVRLRGMGGEMLLKKDVYACAVTPALQAIVVHLSGEGTPPDYTDQAVVRQIAAAINVASPPDFDPADVIVTLPEGIELSPPTKFRPVVQNDANRTDRLLWRQIAPGEVERAQLFEQNWCAIEVVGCLFPRLDAKDPKRQERATSALITMLLVRDQRWRDAKVTAIDNNGGAGGWQADAPVDLSARVGGVTGGGDPQQRFLWRAYLLPDASGRALLAVFTGGFDGDGVAIEHAWKELSAKVKFLPTSDVAQLEDAGAAEASRLKKQDLDKLLEARDEQWWLWTNNTDHPHLGWSHLDWEPKSLEAREETRLRTTGGGEVTRIQSHWTIKPDGQQYHADVTRTDMRGQESDVLRQVTMLRGSQLSISVQSHSATIAQWKMPAPAPFIPGPLLAQVMGGLADGPMLLRTDSWIDDAAAIGPLEPLSLVVRTVPNTSRKAEGEDKPMRCLSVQVNGSGRVSRWFFRKGGELETVELPGGVQRSGSELDTIRFDFGHDSQMTP